MFLIDTNIFLEYILRRSRMQEELPSIRFTCSRTGYSTITPKEYGALIPCLPATVSTSHNKITRAMYLMRT